MRHAILATLLGGALLAGCGSSDKSGGATTTKVTASSAPVTSKIEIKDFLFSPASATVKVGQTVSVTNEDTASHTLTDKAPTPSFDSGTIEHGQTRTVTFKKTGTFKYYCQFHATMSGTVTVVQ